MIKELLKRPIGVTMSVIAIVVLSIVAMGYLPVSLMPDIDIPQITIQVSAPGLSVREVDNTLLKPLKNQLSQVAGLKNITAEARADAGAIYMDFEPNGNIDLIFIEVNEKLDRAVTALPKDVERPKVIKASVTDIPAFYLNLSLKSGAPREPGKPREAGIDFTDRTVAANGYGRYQRCRYPGIALYSRLYETDFHGGRDRAARKCDCR